MREFLARLFPGRATPPTAASAVAPELRELLARVPEPVAFVRLDANDCIASQAFLDLRGDLGWQPDESLQAWLNRNRISPTASCSCMTADGRRWLLHLSPLTQHDYWLSLERERLPSVDAGDGDPRLSAQIFGQASVGIALVRDGVFARVNEKFSELFLYESDDLLGQSISSLFAEPGQGRAVIDIVREALQHGGDVENEYFLRRRDGRQFWCNLSVRAIADEGGGFSEIWVFKDASLHKGIEDNLRQAAVVFESSADGIIILDARRNIKLVNSSFSRITGYASEEVIGKNPRMFNSGKQSQEFYERLWAHVEKKGPWQGEIWNRRKNGELYPEWCSVTPVRGSGGDILEYVMIFSDITQRKQIENRLRYQANFDALTDLPNRSLFIDRLTQGLVRARREGTTLALLFIDLDRFKNINDTLGHSAGDKLLVAVARELRNCVRESDTIARFGGDEFAVILSPIYGPKNASTVAQNLLKVLSRPYDIDGYEAVVGGSIGITVFPSDGTTTEELVKNADAAMYRAKEQGRNNYQFFTNEMQQAALARMNLERDLRYAVERNELLLNFQPQLGVACGYVKGMEVLVRWQHPRRGAVSPVEFIGLAEDTGMIVAIGEWVLRTACQQYRVWQDQGIAPPRFAVNVSGRQFAAHNFIKTVSSILHETAVEPACLELELTESILMKDEERVISTLNQLRAMGVLISIDDFGTGYSSLSYLKRFPINTLKIDRSFVMDIPSDADDVAIVKAIISMAHTLKLEVVAEGVEDEEQVSFLRDLDCDYIQGYHYSRPLGTEQCTNFLALEHSTRWHEGTQQIV
ncbi:MAG: EAL domain-containing protein [Gammaproteobacteria bacterium]|nr:EAL domain-containing protein [Gammaproteobacteria bacterium]